MKPTLFLRIASVLAFIHCVLHTIGGVFSSPTHGAEEIAVIDAMKSHRFDVLGSMRSYWDFFFGYGLFVTLGLLVAAILFWQLSVYARNNAALVRSITALFFCNYVIMAIVSWRYFFIAPAITELLIAACLGISFIALKPSASSSQIGVEVNPGKLAKQANKH
ncbi:MAG: LIC_13387 family protein [Terriglobales bacterium]|jgi:hypothetical protein